MLLKLYVLLCTDNKIHITNSQLIYPNCKPDIVTRVLIEQFNQASPDAEHLLVETLWKFKIWFIALIVYCFIWYSYFFCILYII